jgi:hypothetical protein
VTQVRWVKHPDLPFLWIDIVLADESWRERSEGFYLPKGHGAWWLRRELAGELHEVRMPIVFFEDIGVSFEDGRHRFCWMRDKGARRMPVSVALGEDIARARFGGRRTP